MRFLKLELTWDASPWVHVLSDGSKLAWVKLLCYAKASGLNGRVKRLAPSYAAKVWLIGEEDIYKMETAATTDGAIVVDDGDWVITNWAKYQGDDTGAERQRRFREVRKQGECNGDNALRNGSNVEEKRREEKRLEEKRDKPLNPLEKGKRPVLVLPSNLEPHREAIEEWLAYKREKGQTYKPRGLECLLSDLATMPNPTAAIKKSMACNYAGVFDKGSQPTTSKQPAQRVPTAEQLSRVQR